MPCDYRKTISDSTKIFSLPVIYKKINEAIDDPESSYEDIAEIIVQDVGLSARLLKIVNSSFYSFPEKIETITHAITVVGSAQLRDLALGAYVVKTFRNISSELISIEAFWKHSIGTGIAAKTLGIYKKFDNPERLYITGMLHEVGRLLILANFQDEIEGILERSERNRYPLYIVEKEKFGWDHAFLGAALLEAWNFSESQIEAIRFHHSPSDAKQYQTDSILLHFGDAISHALGLGDSGEKAIPPIRTEFWEHLGAPIDILPDVFEKVESQFNETVDLFLG